MAIKEIYQSKISGGTEVHESVLRSNTILVETIDKKILEIIEDMRDTLWAYPFCIGLSAPQIGERYAISIINLEKRERANDLILINPKIVEESGKKDRKRESCMSVWGKCGEVERRDKIVVEYRDLSFNLEQRQFDGFISRTIQHEIDHLHGVLYIDKIVPNKEIQEAALFGNFKIIKNS